jgi:thiamine biosynthesis lipoprotein
MKTVWILFIMSIILWGDERTQVHMGTLISVQTPDIDTSDAVFNLFRELDESLSTYKNDSEISRLNRLGEMDLTPRTQKVLECSLKISALTHGMFDITIGSISYGAYRFGRDERLPDENQLHKALTHVGIDKLKLTGNHAHLAKGSVIDLGGIGKGYAVDLAMDLLQKQHIKSAVVAASGDIGCIGPCDVSIADPFHSNSIFTTLHSKLPRFAISTSGNYERYIKNKSHNHLLNPKTGQSEQLFASVTLYSDGNNTALDAIATAVSIMTLDDALALLKDRKIEYFLILNNGNIFKSKGMDSVNQEEVPLN